MIPNITHHVDHSVILLLHRSVDLVVFLSGMNHFRNNFGAKNVLQSSPANSDRNSDQSDQCSVKAIIAFTNCDKKNSTHCNNCNVKSNVCGSMLQKIVCQNARKLVILDYFP